MDEEMRVRREIVERCKAEMLGPGSEDIGGNIETEVISDSPIERYSLGILFPQNSNYELNDEEKPVKVEKEPDEDVILEYLNEKSSETNISKSYVEDGVQDQITMTNQFLPSAMGLTFFAQGEINSLNIRVSASTYRESSFKDCCVRIENSLGIEKYYLNDFIYVEGEFVKLKKNISKKDVYELVSGREIEKERPELVSILYKLADLCTVNRINTGYVRNPLLKKKLVTVDLAKEFNQTYINEKGDTSVNEDIIKVTVLKKSFGENIFSYTVMLVNNQKDCKGYKNCLFQPELRINSEENNIKFIEHSYMSKRGIGIVNDEDLVYELLYRNKKSYAIGHGVASGQAVDDNLGAGEIYTDFFPSFEVPQLEFSISELDNSENILSMFELSDLSKLTKKEKTSLLNDFCKSYEKWIEELKESSKRIDKIFDKVVKEQITKCIETLNRMKRGVEILSQNDKVYSAFNLMNRAMLIQREHSKFNGGEFDRYPGDSDFPKFNYMNIEKKYGSWRAFQLAFILINIEGISNVKSSDRDIVDLIWIPTGGGKTEAYLGLTGFTIFLRRLTDPVNGGGTTIIMRYTLRLLAAQQFVRASILICACEKIRRESKELNLGKDEISIGLWVGGTPTPNNNIEAKKLFKLLTKSTSSSQELDNAKKNNNKFQVLKCPWCGTKLEIEYVDGKKKGNWGYDYDKKKIIFCPEPRCDFHKKLPIQVVDEELYKEPPTLLFGTVDKFAALPWEGEVSKLFALDKKNKRKQPELIIQDELHLISGPLGSMVGLYETAIDAMCSNICSENPIRPKIIASTATIKRASEQCKMLFNRQVSQFPPSGINIEDSYFIREIPIDIKHGRQYIGIMPSGKTPTTTQVRLYTAILQSLKFIEAPDKVLDKYWTMVGYFNSIRELGKTSNLVVDDIASNNMRYMKRLLKSNDLRFVGYPQELTSRVESTEIVKILKNLENNYKRNSKKDNEYNSRPIDVLLASNMISVGVDISRLDLMVISGQPKQTSEYIQASSRVGRKYPGVVFTLYNPSKTRDRSHYELFYPYHQTFYKYVEPTSITPFSEQARERGLHAIFISMVRHLLKLIGDEDAHDFKDSLDNLNIIKDYILERAKDLDNTELQDVAIETKNEIESIIERWDSKVKTAVTGDRVCYKSKKYGKNLLIPFLDENENNAFPTMQSLRNVDSEAKVDILVLGENEDE
ncbi:helicase-related protein [Clostridium sp. AL.422]|uniref:helicase-related protein n=1 Tax=Clostridium TaxID=1485 RepID=UPI00293DAA2C|nr:MULTISPECIES: helicase-related protein [unclassified Clostridium]MDV4152121.1 helicase-related protein [Clostridium sp. AL.422]